eukprot:365778-Chlamydomonas_euryale.AAC.20
MQRRAAASGEAAAAMGLGLGMSRAAIPVHTHTHTHTAPGQASVDAERLASPRGLGSHLVALRGPASRPRARFLLRNPPGNKTTSKQTHLHRQWLHRCHACCSTLLPYP